MLPPIAGAGDPLEIADPGWDETGASLGLSAPQLQAYAAAAGFSGADLATAAAVALAESGGNPSAYNPETAAGTPDGQGSYGLWQIYLNAHPEFAGLNLYDPQTNANAAYQVYAAAGGFSPWSTYNSGAYLRYLSSPAPAPLTPLTSITTFAPATGILNLMAMPGAPSPTPIDWTAVSIVGGLSLALIFAFSEL